MAIYDAIASMQTPTRAVVLGMAASAASYLVAAVDRAEMKPNATLMIHRMQGGLWGNADEIERDLDYMVDLENRMMLIYADKTGLPLDEIKRMVYETTYMDAQTALNLGFVDYVDGLQKQPADEPAETPQDEEKPADEPAAETADDDNNETADDEEQGGIVNKILTMAGLKKRGAIIHAPADDERDFQAEIDNLKDTIKQRETEIRNMGKTLEAKQTAFEAYKAGQLEEIANLKSELANHVAALEDTIKTEIHNRIAALGYDANELPAPCELSNTAPVTLDDTARFFRELGLN